MTRVCNHCGGTAFREHRSTERRFGDPYPVLSYACIPCAKVRNNARYARLSADPEWVAARLAKKREYARRKGVRPREELCALAIRKRVFADMLSTWERASRVIVRRSSGSHLWWRRVATRFAAKFGGTVGAAQYRLRYHHDPEFRAKQLERLHKRNAMRDHAIEMASDGTLDGASIKALFAAAKVCPHCPTIMGSRDKTLDHVVPISQGGAHSIANVMVICRACNTSKAGRTLEQWRRGEAFKRGDGQGLRPKVVESEASHARRIARGIAAQEENNRRVRSPEWKEQCARWRAEAEASGKWQWNAA